MTVEHEIMTLPEVAKHLGVSERTIYDWAQKGKIPAAKLGNAWRFKRSEIDHWNENKRAK
ncbi:MAG: helix-turn-helix domain-containing protein [Candidatus Eisenbacteria sp.]|nr:helix-turn-helix domain-containing protein [Candidatus Eisenbacteria bacterium]